MRLYLGSFLGMEYLCLCSYFHRALEHANVCTGGGSSSMVHDGVIINYPSDRKPPSCLPGMEYHCERPVSSILCVQEYQEDMIKKYWAFSSLLAAPRILPLIFLICLSCIGGCVIARVALKRPVYPAHAKQRAFLREEGVNNLSSGDEEANMSASSDNCGV